MVSKVSRILASGLAALCLTSSMVSPSMAMDDAQKKELGAFIKQYLIENPEVLQEAQAAFEKKQAAQQAEKSAQVVESNRVTRRVLCQLSNSLITTAIIANRHWQTWMLLSKKTRTSVSF